MTNDMLESETQTVPANAWPDDAKYAGFYSRAFAVIIDTLVLMFPLSIVLGIVFSTTMGARMLPDTVAMQHLPPNEMWAQFMAFFTQPEVLNRLLLENGISFLVAGIFTILFWYFLAATPGKLVLGIKIVDAESGLPTTKTQDIVRYIGYMVSCAGLLLGFIWVMFDKRKQGWHDKMAGTVVVYKKSLPADIKDLTRKQLAGGRHGT